MVQSASGLILRIRPFTETSLVVQWLTPGAGRIATIAKGALRAKSAFRGKLDVFFLADFSFNRSQRSELHTLREVVPRETHPGLRQDLARLQQAAYAATLIEQATETETPIPEVYDLMVSTLQQALSFPSVALTIFAFELRFLELLGMGPAPADLALPLGTLELVKALQCKDWKFIARLQASADQIADLDRFLHDFILFHLGRVPKGRRAAIMGDR
jgi:DNA repair protein RecO (recombination protein O)